MKKSFWKRCNRGFVVSMALLIVVVLYVTVTQIMLMGQKRDIRDVCESVDALLAQHAQMSADQLAELKQEAPRKAFEEAVREKLKPFFVKDAAYLSEAVTSYVNTVVGLADNEMSFTSLKDDDKDDSIRIDEDTAAVSYTHEYEATGVWPVYQANGTVTEGQTQSGTAVTNFNFSMKLEDGAWKIYRVSQLAFYNY